MIHAILRMPNQAAGLRNCPEKSEEVVVVPWNCAETGPSAYHILPFVHRPELHTMPGEVSTMICKITT